MQKNTTRQLTNTSTVSTSPTIVRTELLIKGSIPYWDQKEAFKSFEENVSVFNYVNLFWYFLGNDGSVVKYRYANEDQSIIEFAHKNNVSVSMVITNLPEDGSWSSERVENVISDETLRQKHIENIVYKLRELNFDGVIIDYELLRPNVREEFSVFIQELSVALDAENRILTVVLHPKTGENISGEEISRFQDWKTLAKYSDQLQIMGYSQHSDEDAPGPIAGANWVEKIIEYAKSTDVPAEKIFLGIPLYGYDWNKSSEESARGLTYEEVKSLMLQKNKSEEFDDISKSPHFTYDDRDVWFENAKSVLTKAQLAQNAGFAGITFWRLGGEDPSIWEMLQQLD